MKKNLICILLSTALLLTCAACGGKESSDEPRNTPPPEEDGASAVAAPQENEVLLQTFEVPLFGLQFDCPVVFANDTKNHIISEDHVNYTVKRDERSFILISCSRMARLNEWAQLASATGKDSSALYEGFESLDVDEAIESRRDSGYETFELLDSFSTATSYGFYYTGKSEDFGTQEYDPELSYEYKNHGGFSDGGGIINVNMTITVPEEEDREAFTAFCEAVTSSLRLPGTSGGESGGVAGPEPEPPVTALSPLEGDTYDARCREIVDLFFSYAFTVRCGGSPSGLMLLIGGDEALFQSMRSVVDGPLDGSHSYVSDWAFQGCEEDPQAKNGYIVYVDETRRYDEEELGLQEYLYNFFMTVNSPTDYCVTGIDSVYYGPVDSANFEYDPSLEVETDEQAMQHTYGTNAQIEDYVFNRLVDLIRKADQVWAAGDHCAQMAYVCYESACDTLETLELTDTPLYRLALDRWVTAYNAYEAYRESISPH